jgi:hypothetical protein
MKAIARREVETRFRDFGFVCFVRKQGTGNFVSGLIILQNKSGKYESRMSHVNIMYILIY